jgi:hypothetical protein
VVVQMSPRPKTATEGDGKIESPSFGSQSRSTCAEVHHAFRAGSPPHPPQLQFVRVPIGPMYGIRKARIAVGSSRPPRKLLVSFTHRSAAPAITALGSPGT